MNNLSSKLIQISSKTYLNKLKNHSSNINNFYHFKTIMNLKLIKLKYIFFIYKIISFLIVVLNNFMTIKIDEMKVERERETLHMV